MNTFHRTDLSPEALRTWQEAHPELDPDKGKPMPKATVNHDYDTPAQKAEQFREEIRASLAEIAAEVMQNTIEINGVIAELAQIRAGLTQAASQPTAGQTTQFLAVSIAHGVDENGKEFFKVRGGPYAKNGVRVWPEVLKVLGYDESLAYGVTQIETPFNVLVEMHDYYDAVKKETRVTPYKIVGKA